MMDLEPLYVRNHWEPFAKLACALNSPHRRPPTSYLPMFKNISIRVRLALAMSFLGVLLIIGGVMGIVGVSMGNNDVQELYSSRLSSSEALGQANVALSRVRLWLYRIALDPASPDVPKETQTARDLLTASKQAWAAYRAMLQVVGTASHIHLWTPPRLVNRSDTFRSLPGD